MATRSVSRAAKAQSRSDSIIAAAEAAKALAPALEKLLVGINAVPDQGRAAAEGAPVPADEYPHPHDRTDNRIRAFLASVRSTRDVIYRDDIAEANARGRCVIERLAISAADGDPKLRLTAGEMADVLSFLRCSEPIDLQGWWNDTYDGPSWICGYHYVLGALEQSLRGQSEAANAEELCS